MADQNSRQAMRKAERSPKVEEAFAKMIAEREAYFKELPMIRKDGVAALHRLLPIAQGHSGQCRYVAAFLLGLYNGQRFPFDLTDFRGLDLSIFNDCMAVLRMDKTPECEVHIYFDNGSAIWEDLAKRWGIKDHWVNNQRI